MRNSDELMDSLFDQMLAEAAEQAADELGAETAKPEPAKFSAEHEQRIEGMFRRYERKERIKKFRKYAARAACVLLAAAVVGTGGMMSVSAWRSRVMNFLFDSEKPNTEIHFTDGENFYGNDFVSLGYIPEDFAMSDDLSDNVSVLIDFEEINGGDGYFGVHIDPVSATVKIDTENATMERLTVNGCEGLFSSKENLNILLWGDDSYIYCIGGNIDKNEMIKIAEKIIYV